MRWPVMLGLALAVTAPGCTSDDPCAGHDGTCVGLLLSGAGIGTLDSLQLRSHGDAALVGTTARAGAIALPARTAVYLDASVAGSLEIEVDGALGNTVVATGVTPLLRITPGSHQTVGVTLAPLGAPDLGASDLGAPGDAGRDDGGMPSTDAGRTPDCPTQAYWCESFEPDWSPSWTALVDQGLGVTLTVQQSSAYSGLNGLGGSVPASPGNSSGIYRQRPFGSPPSTSVNKVTARFFFRAGSDIPNYVTLLRLEDGSGGFVSLNIGEASGGTPSSNYLSVYSSTQSPTYATAPIAKNTWYCASLVLAGTNSVLSWQVPGAGSANTVTGSGTLTRVSNVAFGMYTTPTSGMQIDLDDLVLASGSLPCP